MKCSNCQHEYEYNEANCYCPNCGQKNVLTNIDVTVEIDTYPALKGKIGNKHKRRYKGEFKFIQELDIESGKSTYRQISIDREKDEYREKVILKKTGEIIIDKVESLSKHIGHGNAKKIIKKD